MKKTCFEFHKDKNKCCKQNKCKHWIDYKTDKNCTLISAQTGGKTLQEIGNIYGVTRMRIGQIEKGILKKLSLFLKK